MERMKTPLSFISQGDYQNAPLNLNDQLYALSRLCKEQFPKAIIKKKVHGGMTSIQTDWFYEKNSQYRFSNYNFKRRSAFLY